MPSGFIFAAQDFVGTLCMEGIARVMYCTLIERRIVVLHSFVKKTDKIPATEMAIAKKRLAEIKGRN